MFSEDDRSEDDDEDMEVEDEAKQSDDASQAVAVAKALGKTSKSKNSGTKFDDITDGLKELDMDHYDDEDDGSFKWLFFDFYSFISFVLFHFQKRGCNSYAW